MRQFGRSGRRPSDSIDWDRFKADGFTTVRLLGDRQTYDALGILEGEGWQGAGWQGEGWTEDTPFFASPAQAWGVVAQAIDTELRQIAAERFAELLPTHRVVLCGFTAKGRRGGPVAYHQDWTYTDERSHRAVLAWCPLVDVDGTNGCLKAVRGSHRWSTRIRPSRRSHPGQAVKEPPEYFSDELDSMAVEIPLSAGDALVFDPALLHGSGANTSDRARPAFTTALAPRGVSLLHFHQEEGGDLEGFAVDDNFFTTNPYGCRPSGFPHCEPWTEAISVEDIRRNLPSVNQ